MIFSSKRKCQEKNIAETQCKDLYRTLHQRKRTPQCQWNKYEGWQQQHYTEKFTQKQWEQPFLSLYKNTKQKEVFDIQYKFLHSAQPSLTYLREIGQDCGSTECVRCNRAEDTETLVLLLRLLIKHIYIPSLFTRIH